LERQPKTICLHFRSDAYVSRARQAAFPYTTSFSSDYILKRADRLLREFVAEKKGGGITFPACTNLALTFQGLERQERGQKGIEGFLGQQSAAPAKRPRSPSATPASPESKRTPVEVSYDCPKCRKTITKQVEASASEGVLETVMSEHSDWHYARDLLQSEKVTVGPFKSNSHPSSSKTSRPTAGAAPAGSTLQSFFKKKSR
jgi:hypothetical protein